MDKIKDIYIFRHNFLFYCELIQEEYNLELIIDDLVLFLQTKIINQRLIQSNQYYCLFIAIYYEKEEYNKKLLKKYYLNAIENGNSLAMCFFGAYYEYIKKNTNKTQKYYFMALKNKNKFSAYLLGNYYLYTEINNSLMKKYYLMFGKHKYLLYLIYNTYKKNKYKYL